MSSIRLHTNKCSIYLKFNVHDHCKNMTRFNGWIGEMKCLLKGVSRSHSIYKEMCI